MRKIIVAIVALMTSLSAFAADFNFLAKGGVSISKFNLDESENRMGVAAGFGAKFHISESKFFLMPQAMYAQKGHEKAAVITDDAVLMPVMYHMIEVPVLFGAEFEMPVKDMSIDFGVGPYISYDYRLNEYNEGMNYIMVGNDIKPHLLSHGDLGVAFTFEVQYKRLVVFYDYDLGLRDIAQGSYNLGQKLSHRSMRIGVGYAFPTMSIGKQRKKPQM